MSPSAAAVRAGAQDAAPIEFVRFCSRGWRGTFVAGSPLHEWLLCGGSPDEIPTPTASVVRDGSRSRCARIDRLDDEHPLPQPLFFKAYRRRPGMQARLKRMIGWHLPPWVWKMSWRLIDMGVAVPRPMGFLVPQVLRHEKQCYFWSEWITGAGTATQLARSPHTRAVVVESTLFAQRSAEFLARLHEAGVYHRDMNWGNLLVDPASVRVWLVDLDSAHRWTLNAGAAASRDLARFLMDALTLETSEQWRQTFLDTYAQRRGVSAKALERQVAVMVEEFFKRRGERLRRLALQTPAS